MKKKREVAYGQTDDAALAAEGVSDDWQEEDRASSEGPSAPAVAEEEEIREKKVPAPVSVHVEISPGVWIDKIIRG